MDHDAPEREWLNLYEIATILQVDCALFVRALTKATAACAEFAEAAANALPMDDWDDDVIAECAGR